MIMKNQRGDEMLGISREVYRGILYLRMSGSFTKNTCESWKKELDQLFYQQGLHYFVLNFQDVDDFDMKSLSLLRNKIKEICLHCGKVAVCGIDFKSDKRTFENENLYVVNDEWDACKYLYL